MAEVRPWDGQLISIGQFKLLRDLRVINCTTKDRPSHICTGGVEPAASEREEHVWADIDKAFARPTARSDNLPDYVPTQIIVELFRVHGFDGLAYRSSLGAGHNIALFDLNAAQLVGCGLYRLAKIHVEFEEAGNPYSIRNNDEQGEL